MEAVQRFCYRVDVGFGLVVCYVRRPFSGCNCEYWNGRVHESGLYTQELAHLLVLSCNGLRFRYVKKIRVFSIYTKHQQFSPYLRSQNRFQKSQLARCTLV